MNSEERRTDREIAQDILRHLRSDGRVRAAEVSAEVENGLVTLRGSVGSWAQSVAARKVASEIRGVLEVEDRMDIQVPAAAVRGDEEIAHALRHALVWNAFVPESAVQFTVLDGEVTLRGCVEEASQCREAERLVCSLAGVRRVCNLIEIKPSEDTAYDVGLAIEEALERHVHALARNLHIHVEKGVATVSGAVDSVAERDVIVAAASRVVGVTLVEEHLRIGPAAQR